MPYTLRMISDPQQNFIASLLREGRSLDDIPNRQTRELALNGLPDGNLTAWEASRIIDALKAIPATRPTPHAAARPAELPHQKGMYLDREHNQLFWVYPGKENPDKFYAKRLKEIPGKRLNRLDEDGNPVIVHHDFVYEPGLIYTVRPEWRLTDEEARPYAVLYGICYRCGAFLKDATSVRLGIGPVCRGEG